MKKINILILSTIITFSSIICQETEVKKVSGYSIFPIIGQISPLGENIRNAYDAGYTIGLGVNTSKEFTFFKKDWILGASIQHYSLKRHESGKKAFEILTIAPQITTTFNQMIFNIGVGIASTSSHNHKTDSIFGQINLVYLIYNKNSLEIILNINLLEIFKAPNPNGSSELYGINLAFSKNL